jgi:RNA polymerase sigma factor (sigma-70 family)
MTAGTVLRQLRSRLQQLLRRRGQTREDAEDVIQDAFLRLQVYYRKGGQVREPEAFLVRTAMRLASNYHRDARRRIQAQERVKTLPLVDMEPAPEEMMAAEQTLQSVARKLDSVSCRTREVFLLHRVDGLSYAQISKLYGMTTKAVERRIARAMLAIYQDDPDAGHERSME